MRITRVVFNLAGKGVIFDPVYPIHLDALVAWGGAFRYPPGPVPSRDEPIEELPLPLLKRRVNGHEVFCASALWPVGEDHATTAKFWRRRFREHLAHGMAKGAVNYTSGPMRSHNTAMDTLLVGALEGWFIGDRGAVKKWFRPLRFLGRKRSMGCGEIASVEYHDAQEDWTMERDGIAMRFLPHPAGIYDIRARPPYWHQLDKVPSLVPGELVP